MSSPERREELAKEGWEEKTTYDEPRLSEMVETYRELGFEVLLEPFECGTETESCSACMMQFPKRYKTIYVRKQR